MTRKGLTTSARPVLVRPSLLALLLALVVGLAGCVNVPTTGPIDKVEGQEPGCQNCVNVEVAPPAAGDEPRQIVEGYLRATSNYQPNYSVAKQFLTRSAAETWSPEVEASIYRGTTKVLGDTVTLEGTRVGTLADDRTYTALDQKLDLDLAVTKEDGEWRINKPPPGLLINEVSFDSFYQAYELYFVGNGRSLVPDSIYLPVFRNPSSVASALVKALLGGPSKWLKPAVSTAIPPETTLSVDSVTITNGIAEVPLSDAVKNLSDEQRTLLAAQVVYTLKQILGIKGVLFTVDQQPFLIPGSDRTTRVVSVEAVSTDLDPIPFVAADQLYAVRGRTVQQVSGTADPATLRPVPGRLGQGAFTVDSLAVSVAVNTDLAVVTDDRTILRRGPTADASGEVRTVKDGVSDLLRPQFTRYNELWAVGRRDDRQRMWVFTADREVEVDAAGLFEGGEVVAFKVSPDGTRVALIRKTSKGPALGLARIIRSGAEKITVDGWRPLDTTQSNKAQVTQLKDVSWLDATNLLVLGAATEDAPLGPVAIAEDASSISVENQANRWNAVELTVQLRPPSALIVGRGGHAFIDDGNQWRPFLDRISTIAYPG